MGPWWQFINRLVWLFMTVAVVYCLLVIDFNYVYPVLAGSIWLVYRMFWRLGWFTQDIEQLVPSVLGGLLSGVAFIAVDADQAGYAPAVLAAFMGLIAPRFWLTKVARRSFPLRKKVPLDIADYNNGWVMIESGQPRLDMHLQSVVPDVHWKIDRTALANESWRHALEALGMPRNQIWPLIARIENNELRIVWSPEWLFQAPPEDVFVKQDSSLPN